MSSILLPLPLPPPPQFIEAMSPSDMKSLLFVKVLEKKPGWKDSNFQVMKAKLSIVGVLAAKATVFGRKSALCALPAVVEKLSDVKVGRRGGRSELTAVPYRADLCTFSG